MINNVIREELLAMVTEDQRVREDLAADGGLFDGYHPQMAAVHRKNGQRLAGLVKQHGWLGKSLVGDDGAEAAWIILQHNIGDPDMQRGFLPVIKQAAANGELPAKYAAMLEDRICMYEGRPQIYGTQYDWDEHGQLSPWPIADLSQIDKLRKTVGLGPIEENTRILRARAAKAGEKPPVDYHAHRKMMVDWCHQVGWRK